MSQVEFKMPKMGESITEGTVISWLVKEGESFEEGDILIEVATDKVDNEVPAPLSGTMIAHKVREKDVVPVGNVIAILELNEGGVAFISSEDSSDKKKENASIAPVSKKQNIATKPTTFKVNENVFVSPLVDSVARKHHISYEELARIPGTGKEGRLRKSDVLDYISEGRPFQFAQPISEVSGFKIPDLQFDKGKGRIVEMDRMRKLIADHMVYSKHTSPNVTAYVEADLTEMVQWRNKKFNYHWI